MRSPWRAKLLVSLICALTFVCTACGGGGTGNSNGGSNPPPVLLQITNDSILPGGLEDHAYNTTLSAVNGSGELHWSIAPIDSTTLFVDGLTIDSATGVLSGTLKFGGTSGFVATVRDSGHSATKTFTITAYSPLQAPAAQTYQVGQFQDFVNVSVGPLSGVTPLSFQITSGHLPFGMKIQNVDPLNNHYVVLNGSPTEMGSFPVSVRVQDSFSPPEVVTAQFTIQVIPRPLEVADSLPRKIGLNRPFNGRVIARGGVAPYTFSKTSGNLPPGLSAIDPSGGQINGTPTTAGDYSFVIGVADSSEPPQTSNLQFVVSVQPPLGRNDTAATATPIDNGAFVATLSPYVDPPGSAPLPGDTDYYKLVSVAGSTVHVRALVSTFCCGLPATDPVLEIVDGNNSRLGTCNQPNGTSTFSSACINDDSTTDGSSLDSALDLKVPGPASSATTFYVHVLDFRGDARPDMRYQLYVNGVVPPLAIHSLDLLPADRGLPYSQQLTALNSNGATSWTVTNGALPPGLHLASSGLISGTATTDGNYSFTVRAADSSTPPQTATAQGSILVGEPVKITSSAQLPDACLNQNYSFTPQATGGIPPLTWGYTGFWILGLDQRTGTMTGVPGETGTFTLRFAVTDASNNYDAQQITLVVKECP
jgi:large repetitive protein